MTRIELAPDLSEAALLQWMDRAEAAEDPDALSFRRWRDAAYDARPGSARERAFRRQADHWAARLDFAGPFRRALERCPHVADAVERLAVRRAVRRKDEGSELWRDPARGRARLSLHVLASRFLDSGWLERFARIECLRAEDMLDPSFGYEPGLPAELDGDPARAEIVRDRLRELGQRRLVRRAAGRSGAEDPVPALEARRFPDRARSSEDAATWSELLACALDTSTAGAPA